MNIYNAICVSMQYQNEVTGSVLTCACTSFAKRKISSSTSATLTMSASLNPRVVSAGVPSRTAPAFASM